MNIYLCEDDPKQLVYYTGLVEEICQSQLKLTAAIYPFSHPDDLLENLKQTGKKASQKIILLDIHLTSEVSGIEVAQTLRNLDIDADIVFLTTDVEQMPVAFHSQTCAVDFLMKTDFDTLYEGLVRCIKRCENQLMSKSQTFTLVTTSDIIRVPFDELLFFCTNGKSRTLELHTLDSCIEFKGKLKELAVKYPQLLFVHQGFLVNPEKIKSYHKSKRLLEMCNGEICEVGIRHQKKVLSTLIQKSVI
ncbi:LytR/AlgR family response regulator transcription factor [Enterococcus sp.]|uniref:LytR/AlgR family response regulator transcription factor n=1 Tax=Enterococcus sp. TaxID=35783 RepID=UPI003C73090B